MTATLRYRPNLRYDFNFSDPVHHEWEVESVRSWDDVDVDPSGSNVDSASVPLLP